VAGDDNRMPEEAPPPGKKWAKDASGAWTLVPITGTDPAPTTGKMILVNGVPTWVASPNAMYVKGSAEDPMVQTERNRMQREYNAAYYAYMTVGGNTSVKDANGSSRAPTRPSPR
jgi:hypothetical protein